MTNVIDFKQPYSGTLNVQLTMLRAHIDELARSLANDYGESDETTLRAEQLSAAIQRLEWALQRQKTRRGAATIAACA